MEELPRLIFNFFKWWLYDTPKRIFVIGKRLIILVNSQIAFSLNIRLLFTPLFGDYTIIGRFIGFVVRIFEIVFGLVFMLIISVIIMTLPAAWVVGPFLILYFYKTVLAIVAIPILYLAFVYITRRVPALRVSRTNDNNYLDSFRPSAKKYQRKLISNFKKGFELLTQEQAIKYLLKKAELEGTDFVQEVLKAHRSEESKIPSISLETAKKHETRYVELEHVFYAAISIVSRSDLLLAKFGSRLEFIEETAKWIVNEREHLSKLYIWQDDYEMLFTGGIGKGMTGHVTPNLDSISVDLTKTAKRGGYERFSVREDFIGKIAKMLSGSNDNILIIGEPGSGKTSVVKGMAFKVLEGSEYKALQNKRIVSMEMGGIIGGTKSHGELAGKLNKAIKEAKSSGDIILFVDEIHTLVAGGGDEEAEVSVIFSILESQLSKKDIQFMGATSKQNYRKYVEPNGAFSRLFNIVELEPTSKEETIEVLKYEIREAVRKRDILITYPALEEIIKLSKKLIHERVFPDKAIKILHKVISDVEKTTGVVDKKAVAKEISELTHVPVESLSEEEAQKLLNIEREMKKMVIGQDHALSQIAAALKRARAGIRNEEKPIASFLFVGTTGVGKTQTAKSLAKSYFGNPKNMIRLDMSEYQQADSMSRLIGAPDGSSKGVLTESVRSKPFSLILLDELEKAHPSILLAFLQVFDDGILTDSSGTTIDFTNNIIISTSNVGTRQIQEAFVAGKSTEEMKETAMKEVRDRYVPELLNRFTGIIVFNPLTKGNLREIAKLLLQDVKKMADKNGFKVDFKEELIDLVAEKGYNPEWGARPMARLIEDTIASYLANKILEGEIKQGDEITLGPEVM